MPMLVVVLNGAEAHACSKLPAAAGGTYAHACEGSGISARKFATSAQSAPMLRTNGAVSCSRRCTSNRRPYNSSCSGCKLASPVATRRLPSDDQDGGPAAEVAAMRRHSASTVRRAPRKSKSSDRSSCTCISPIPGLAALSCLTTGDRPPWRTERPQLRSELWPPVPPPLRSASTSWRSSCTNCCVSVDCSSNCSLTLCSSLRRLPIALSTVDACACELSKSLRSLNMSWLDAEQLSGKGRGKPKGFIDPSLLSTLPHSELPKRFMSDQWTSPSCVWSDGRITYFRCRLASTSMSNRA
mmetsp:Transcript_9707/g.18696  ORF Transcript_9707/g.18696 Transcript_9707/m.18696 type:complete len:298 (-) Transcript_9707:563-1456(-)